MKVEILSFEEIGGLLGEPYNPPLIQNQQEENLFQAEIRVLYEKLIETLSVFGEEGDYYGISDFAVRPDLRFRSTYYSLAPHVREFTLTILTETFFKVIGGSLYTVF